MATVPTFTGAFATPTSHHSAAVLSATQRVCPLLVCAQLESAREMSILYEHEARHRAAAITRIGLGILSLDKQRQALKLAGAR